MATSDPSLARDAFPILDQPARNGTSLVYLDNAATSQKPTVVLDALRDYYAAENANVHRGMHLLAERATDRYENARRAVARFINAPLPSGVILTGGTTESINLVAHAWARPNLQSGDRIVATVMEHHANLVPWQLAAEATGAELTLAPMHDDGTLDLDALLNLIRDDATKLLALTHISNVLGTRNPVEELTALAHEHDVRVLIDGAQAVPHMPVDLQSIGCDWYVFSGHKMCGPTGIGVLAGTESAFADMQPFLAGGEMIDQVHDDHSTWAELPYKFEAGTPNIAGAAGLHAAIDFLESLGMDAVESTTHALATRVADTLAAIDGVTVLGPPERSAAVSFLLDGCHPHDIAQVLDQEGIAIRAGHLCCQPLMRRLNVPAVARASVYFYNTPDEADRLGEGLAVVKKLFRL